MKLLAVHLSLFKMILVIVSRMCENAWSGWLVKRVQTVVLMVVKVVTLLVQSIRTASLRIV